MSMPGDPGGGGPEIPREYGATSDGTSPREHVPAAPDLVADSIISRPLMERMAVAEGRQLGVVIELRTSHPGGVRGAYEQVNALVREVAGTETRQVGSYLAVALTADEIRDLVDRDMAKGRSRADASTPGAPRWSIHRLWPNFEVTPLTHRSVITTKCAAAHRTFEASGEGIVWAVLDSGIAPHAHFDLHRNLEELPGIRHRSFVPGKTHAEALLDEHGHGTHVAGILAGESISKAAPLIAAAWYQDERNAMTGQLDVRRLEVESFRGMAPRCRLLSCKVLRDDGTGDVTAVLAALQYINDLNAGGRELKVHGVNLSVGYPFDPSWFGAGLSPVCREVDLLVRSGVVVVVAAGNTGYGFAQDTGSRAVRLGLDMTINDPGNSDLAITVGSTSNSPHVSGVSYFSSKGPTGDGRPKPDLVAPGERIVSAGSGALLRRATDTVKDAMFVEDSGTSMAAPHVSGVIAGFLSVHREFIGRPREVKETLMRSAIDLGRDRSFQGAGLVDAMRAIQLV
ncbi:S8 family peptidase [Acrocarpospora macrocephala]|uniref:Peptidase S8 n=1 Tax=Acrocarpospora macrocephala TaxID=150177 RepID=A0A5M3WUZ4_9ACTN|nr:S8 family peptidase [Acrocarpospora macrocephala]GES11809.1 peptidase S8 [Acrocarpospora macrocephala]